MEKALFITNRLRPSTNAEAFQSTMMTKYLAENCKTHVISTTENPTDLGNSVHHFIPQKVDRSAATGIEHLYSRLGHNVKVTFPDTHAGWTEDAVRKASELLVGEKIKTVITRSMPASTHLIGLRLKQMHPEVMWVASLSDPISINPYQNYSSKGLISRMAGFEKDIFEKADVVTHSNQYAIEAYRHAYGNLANKHMVLSNMFDRQLVEKTRHIFSGSGPLNLAYAGRFYGRRTPEPLFKAIRRFLDSGKGKMKFTIAGAGKSRRLDALVKKYQLAGFVESVSFLEPGRLAELLASSHLLVTIDGDFPVDNIFLPSKNVDYLSMTVPILGITRKGPTADLIEETKSGFWAEPENTAGILDILLAHNERVKGGYDFSPDHAKIMTYHSSNAMRQFWKNLGGFRANH